MEKAGVENRKKMMRRRIAALSTIFFLAILVVWSGGQELRIATSSADDTGDASAGIIQRSRTFVAVAKQAKASVVNVSSTRKASKGQSAPFSDDPLFRRFFGEEFDRRFRQPRDFRQQGLGSGVIVSADGHIVTNNHVVEQADEIEVSLADKRKFKAKVVGTDPKSDLAVLKIEAAGLPTLRWADSTRLEVGEFVLAVGNPFGLDQTVTMGIVSAVGRANVGIVDYEDFIQTDAAINPGNSGGALVNLNGELVGINTAIFTRTGGYMGIGFAIPSSMARSVIDSLIAHGKVVRGWLGVSIQEITEELAKEFGVSDGKGALVADIMEDSPASRAGLERGDIIREFEGKPVNDPVHLRTLVAESAPGTKVRVAVLRNKRMQSLEVILSELPKDATVQSSMGQAQGRHALTGVEVRPPSKDELRELRVKSGVVVRRVDPDSPAARAGVREGDVIREIDRKPMTSVDEFQRAVNKLGREQRVLLLVARGQGTVFLTVNPE